MYKSDEWQERMLAAKMFGMKGDSNLIPYLIDLLHDKVWWVRSTAGHSIKLFENGNEVLKGVLETSIDPYAKDMEMEWLIKGEE